MEPVSSRSATIRHCGRAHVRGKIRRVWRHRYLELGDDGRIRYYELLLRNPTTPLDEPEDDDNVDDDPNQTDEQAPAAEDMILKYTLAIEQARILDVTTLRDIHVGLPRGSFGFTFRGRRVAHHNHLNAYAPNSASPLDFASPAASLLTSPTAKPLTTACKAVNPEGAEPPRDFLCAVSTLEEAQAWVVALQWAAVQHELLDDEDEEEDDLESTWEMASHDSNKGDAENASSPSNKEEELAANLRFPSEIVEPPPLVKRAFGKMVVTKVCQFCLVRINLWQWEIAYQVHVLVVDKSGSSSFATASDGDASEPPSTATASQWMVQCTADDLQKLWLDLKQSGRLDHSLRPLQQLPRRMRHPPTLEMAEQSLSVVDGLLRSLVLDAQFVNATEVKECLGLTKSSSGSHTCRRTTSWWGRLQIHKPGTIWNFRSQIITTPATGNETNVGGSASTQAYVKSWLAMIAQPQKSLSFFTNKKSPSSSVWMREFQRLLLQHSPTLVWGGAGAALACTWPMATLWWRSTIAAPSPSSLVMPKVTLRLDLLIATWMGAAYYGRKYLPPPTKNKPTSNGRDRRAGRRGVQVPTSKSSPQASPSPTVASQKPPQPDVMDTHTVSLSDHHEEEGDEVDDDASDGQAATSDEDEERSGELLSSPLPEFPSNNGLSCWSHPTCDFFVRGPNYLQDKVKVISGPPPLTCLGVDFWLTDNPQRHVARHPSVLGGKLQPGQLEQDTFLVNFLLPFGNFCAYFAVPDLSKFPPKLRKTWQGFLEGDQTYRDARLKLLPIVIDGPWIVKAAVGPGKSPALLGKVIPLQYYFTKPCPPERKHGIYEVDVIITASTIAKGILSVVKGHTKTISIGFAFIIEAAEQEELPENVLCSFQIHSIHIEDCPRLPDLNLDDLTSGDD